MVKPTFMIVGSQKAGTTWLHECLQEHPEIFMPQIKEMHYFSRPEDNRFSRRHLGLEWYLSQFPNDPQYRAIGEATPDYMFYPYVAKDLRELNPQLKLIFLLREPVDRAYSAYWMWRRHKTDLISFEDVVQQHPEFLDRGRYFPQIERFLQQFPREQIFVAIYERVTAEPEAFFRSIFRFLEVDETFVPTASETSVGGTQVLPGARGFLLYKIISPIINLPFIIPLWRKLRKTAIKSILLGILGAEATGGNSKNYAPMQPETRQKLARLFEEDNRRLVEFLGSDIPEWR